MPTAPLRDQLAIRFRKGAALLGMSPERLRHLDTHGGLTVAQDIRLLGELGHGSDVGVRARRRLTMRALLWETAAMHFYQEPPVAARGEMSLRAVSDRLDDMGWTVDPLTKGTGKKPRGSYRVPLYTTLDRMKDDGDVAGDVVWRSSGAIPPPGIPPQTRQWNTYQVTPTGIHWAVRHCWDILCAPLFPPPQGVDHLVVSGVSIAGVGTGSRSGYHYQVTLGNTTDPVQWGGPSRIPSLSLYVYGTPGVPPA